MTLAVRVGQIWHSKKKPFEVCVVSVASDGIVHVKRTSPRRRTNPGPLQWTIASESLLKNYVHAALKRLKERL